MPSPAPTTLDPASPTPAQQLQVFLAATDAPCPSCNYNLRGLTGDTCPECSQRLTLRVGLAEPRQCAFIASLVGLAMGVGFDGLLFLYFLIKMIRFRGASEWRGFLILTLPFFIIEVAALILLLSKRRAFQRRSDAFKAWTIAAAWFITLAGFTLFTTFIK